jgi:predicted ATPase/DNA-binding winged helix-turn-helix (wHTH) protein
VSTRVFEIGPFQLDPDAGVLTRDGKPTALGPRAVAVLKMLVEHANEHVAKARIIDAAWPGLVVEEHNLAVQVNAIRHTLAEAPGGEHWIETLPRRGYRFVGPVKEFIQDHKPEGADFPLRSNLPAPLTSFVGRERELVEIKRLLASRRLVTIVGAGGIGKTRLALQVAAELIDAYRDGVWLVELGAIRDSSLVPTTVAQVLGVRETVGTPITDSLRAYFRPRQVLLLLDNCEHLLAVCAQLTETLLQDAKQLTVIATAREPLSIAGEQSYPLHPLSLPEGGSKLEAMRQSEAVQLFVERVQRQLPDFELTPDRAPAVAELCIHLDGIPLALELAAARARSLSVEQINARLGDRFRLLTGGSRTALPRQQTLRATLDWSYDLLAEGERVVLRRLSIFPGSFTLEAAAAVAFDAATGVDEAIGVLSRLVTASLVVADRADVGVRYRLLETTRAYALEKLARTNESSALRRRHGEFFLDMFKHAPNEWHHTTEADWLARYEPELDNVRAALDWAFTADGDPAIGIALCAAAGKLWYRLGLWHEGQPRLEAAVGSLWPGTSDLDQALLWQSLGEMWANTRPAQAVTAWERAIQLYRHRGDRSVPAFIFIWLGGGLARMGRIEQAATVLAEARSVLDDAAPPATWAGYFLALGFVKRESGDLVGARDDYERCLSLARSAEAESMILSALLHLADLTWEVGDLDTAASGFREAAALIRRRPTASKGKLGQCLTNLAGIHTERGELDEALAAAREGLPLRKESGYTWGAMDHVALRAALAGKTANAARLAGYADAAYVAKAAPREGNEARARSRLHTVLRERLAADALERLLTEGARLTEEEAVRLALEE